MGQSRNGAAQLHGRGREGCSAAIVAILMLASITLSLPARAIVNPENLNNSPTRWAPTYAVAQLSDEAQDSGKLAYFVNWGGLRSTDGWLDCRNPPGQTENCSGDSTLEIGFKEVDHQPMSCSRNGLRGVAGFPPEVEVQMDYLEDDGDAVVWIADLRILRADQLANPDRIYAMWTNCGSDNSDRRDGAFYGQGTADFQVQVGHWTTNKSPATTIADATLNYVPQENAGLVVPEPQTGEFIQTDMAVPWLANASFEDGFQEWYPSADVNLNQVCDRADASSVAGRCHAYLTHTQPSAPGSIGYQDFSVQNFVSGYDSVPAQLTTGSNTGFQFDGAVRCPPASPAYAGFPSGEYCLVGIFIGTASNGGVSEGKYYEVPNDNKWYQTVVEYGAQAADTNLRINVNSYGYPIDIDEFWVSGGL